MKILAAYGALGASHPEELAQCLQYGGFSGCIWSDDRRQSFCDFNPLRLGSQAAKARDSNRLDAQEIPLPLNSSPESLGPKYW
jgi:hypothetical protein